MIALVCEGPMQNGEAIDWSDFRIAAVKNGLAAAQNSGKQNCTSNADLCSPLWIDWLGDLKRHTPMLKHISYGCHSTRWQH